LSKSDGVYDLGGRRTANANGVKKFQAV